MISFAVINLIIPCGLATGLPCKEESEKPLVSLMQDSLLIPCGLAAGRFIFYIKVSRDLFDITDFQRSPIPAKPYDFN